MAKGGGRILSSGSTGRKDNGNVTDHLRVAMVSVGSVSHFGGYLERRWMVKVEATLASGKTKESPLNRRGKWLSNVKREEWRKSLRLMV